MRTGCRRFVIPSGISLSLVASAASADVGLPMLFVTLPAMLVALVPIIALETWILARKLETSKRFQIKPAAVANIVSTIVGIPITWGLLVLLQMLSGGGMAYGIETAQGKFLAVTWQAPWLIPYESDLYWMIPSATMVLMGPFFVISYYIEAAVVTRMERSKDPQAVRKAVFLANSCSYGILAIFALGSLLWSIAQHAG